jgi:hypothetical protein
VSLVAAKFSASHLCLDGACACPPGCDAASRHRISAIKVNDERGTMNDELKSGCLSFIIHRSAFIVSIFRPSADGFKYLLLVSCESASLLRNQ